MAVRTDDAAKDSATAFTVSKTSHLKFANRERVQKPTEVVSFRRIATVEQLQLNDNTVSFTVYLMWLRLEA